MSRWDRYYYNEDYYDEPDGCLGAVYKVTVTALIIFCAILFLKEVFIRFPAFLWTGLKFTLVSIGIMIVVIFLIWVFKPKEQEEDGYELTVDDIDADTVYELTNSDIEWVNEDKKPINWNDFYEFWKAIDEAEVARQSLHSDEIYTGYTNEELDYYGVEPGTIIHLEKDFKAYIGYDGKPRIKGNGKDDPIFF